MLTAVAIAAALGSLALGVRADRRHALDRRLVLEELAIGPGRGYELIERIAARTGRQLWGVIYVHLGELEEAGVVESWPVVLDEAAHRGAWPSRHYRLVVDPKGVRT